MNADPFSAYAAKLANILGSTDWSGVSTLANDIHACWKERGQLFLCGNGGSAGNAVHLANDFLYGVAKSPGAGIRAHALSANSAILTCLANDIGYEKVFAEQLAVLGNAGDLVIVLSGSGNSPNIVATIDAARMLGIKSYAIVGYDGGRCKNLADVAIHFPVDDMQIAEDMQLIVGHMLMQWLYQHRPI